MKVNLFVSKDLEEPYAEIYTDALTDNIQKAMVLLDFEDIFMIRVEEKQTKVYTEDKDYLVKKPLYQIEENLDSNFVRVSKTTIVNLRKIKRVAPSLRGMMFIELKNGLKDNISRKYLSDFKDALDL